MTTVLALLCYTVIIVVTRATDTREEAPPSIGQYYGPVSEHVADYPIAYFNLYYHNKAAFVPPMFKYHPVFVTYFVGVYDVILPVWSDKQIEGWMQEYPAWIGRHTLYKLVRNDTGDAYVIRYENGKTIQYTYRKW
ncbi:hypothetical protein FOL47_010295 [Perkinsus chesapeaki]|uniref:Uncharacterized protein n=1 Tax=Perkinsus chesapeaki TaxID=330153 RepID=A0A7J6L2S6_PERCH|nr:hypothetical protein FOL47_010295 [Perkinsus chesapeaki]